VVTPPPLPPSVTSLYSCFGYVMGLGTDCDHFWNASWLKHIIVSHKGAILCGLPWFQAMCIACTCSFVFG